MGNVGPGDSLSTSQGDLRRVQIGPVDWDVAFLVVAKIKILRLELVDGVLQVRPLHPSPGLSGHICNILLGPLGVVHPNHLFVQA
jgi:hypothetical protein